MTPLDESWMRTLEEVAREAGLPFGVAAAKEVRALSDAYNSRIAPGASSLAARIAFFFARDVPKAEAAVRELVWTGALAMPEDRPLHVLDLGAGLGSATFGVARALCGSRGTLAAKLVDRDNTALALSKKIARKRNHKEGEIDLSIETVNAEATTVRQGGADLVIAENVLTELRLDATKGSELLEQWLELTRDEGSLVVIEPALRDQSRNLQEVRSRLLERGVGIFGPCLHRRACPLLPNPKDWCHEDLAVDLPPWLVPLARAAGLRWQGLTFSYLVLRKDQRTLAASVPDGSFRAVSSLIRTKGKREVRLCGMRADVTAMRLDRDKTAQNEGFERIGRGTLIGFAPAPDDPGRVRVAPDQRVIDVTPKPH